MRQKNHADAEVAVLEEVVAHAADFAAQNFVGNLGEQARAVAGFGVGVERAAVAEVAQGGQPHAEDLVGPFAVDVRDEADAAGVVLVFRLIE